MLYIIIRMAKKGRVDCMEALIIQFRPIIERYGRKLGEDGVSDMILCFIELINKIPDNITNEGGIVNYIQFSIKNHCFRQIKKRNIEKNTLCSNVNMDSLIYCETKFNDVLLECLLLRLSPLQKEIIKKIYFDGLTEVEIAKDKKVTRQYIHNIKAKSLKRLRNDFLQ